MSHPPAYSQNCINNCEMISGLNRSIFKKLRELIDKIEDIDNGIDDIHSSYIRQLMKPFNKTYLYDGFLQDYEYVLSKLSINYTFNNNDALRSINEALE